MQKKNPLSCSVCGIEFENPFVLASATPTSDVDSIKKAFELGWAGAVLKTISPRTNAVQYTSPRFDSWRIDKKVAGFENIELLSQHDLSYWKDGIIGLKAQYPTKVLLASIMAPIQKKDWQNLVLELQNLPIDGFELNFSCPHGMPEQGIGMAIGTNPKIATQITKWVMAVAKKPVFVKLSPNVTSIEQIATAINAAKPDGFTAINTVQSMMGVDLKTLKPLPCIQGYSTFGGYSGNAIRPIGLRCVAQIAKSINKPILGVGGISSWQNAVEYIAVGADVVQVCTEVMINGYGVITSWLKELSDYMKTQNINNISEIKGRALPFLTSYDALNKKQKLNAVINYSKCKKCNKCVIACNESGYKAIDNKDNHPQINIKKCDGCSLCQHVCPYQAITMTES